MSRKWFSVCHGVRSDAQMADRENAAAEPETTDVPRHGFKPSQMLLGTISGYSLQELSQSIARKCPAFRDMQFVKSAKYLGTLFSPEGLDHPWNKPLNHFYRL